MTPAIDVHTHMLNRDWLELLRAHGRPRYELRKSLDAPEGIFLDGAPFMTPQPGHFDYPYRIRQMDEAGVDLAIISLTCPNVYWGGRDVSLKAAQVVNDDMASAQLAYPSRIRWLCSLPWEYPDAAVSELARSCDRGAVGVMVLANIAGRTLADPLLAPVWKEIDRRALPVLVHPTAPPGTPEMALREFNLIASIGFMFDTSLAIARLMFDGFLDRYPDVKLIVSHAGGALPYLVGRLDQCFDKMNAARTKTSDAAGRVHAAALLRLGHVPVRRARHVHRRRRGGPGPLRLRLPAQHRGHEGLSRPGGRAAGRPARGRPGAERPAALQAVGRRPLGGRSAVRVLVMGAGAVGGFYGAALAGRGHAVTFVARGKHLDALRDGGLVIRGGGRSTVLRPLDAVADPAAAGGAFDLVLFTVKGYDTESAARALRPAVGPATSVLTLQNGVESGERLGAAIGVDRVLVGTTLLVTTIAEPGVIVQASPVQRVELGEPSGELTPRLEAIAAALRDAGVEVRVTRDVRRAVWDKFIRLAPGATLATACRATLGELRSSPDGAALYRALIGETVAVGRAAGAALPADAVDAAVALIQSLPADMRTSMQLDFESRRRVELEDITGAVVRLGRRHGVATPTYDVLYGVLKARAATFGGLG